MSGVSVDLSTMWMNCLPPYPPPPTTPPQEPIPDQKTQHFLNVLKRADKVDSNGIKDFQLSKEELNAYKTELEQKIQFTEQIGSFFKMFFSPEVTKSFDAHLNYMKREADAAVTMTNHFTLFDNQPQIPIPGYVGAPGVGLISEDEIKALADNDGEVFDITQKDIDKARFVFPDPFPYPFPVPYPGMPY